MNCRNSVYETCRNGAYHWVLVDGVPTDGKILTYGLAFALLAYSKVTNAGNEFLVLVRCGH